MLKMLEVFSKITVKRALRCAKVIFEILLTLASQTRIQNTIIKKGLYFIPES